MSKNKYEPGSLNASVENTRKLIFFDSLKEIIDTIETKYKEKKVLVVHNGRETKIHTESKSINDWISSNIEINEYSAVAFLLQESELLSRAFLELFSFKGHVLAVRTDLYWEKNPLIVISPPKSGTHLLIKLVESFGYKEGGILPISPQCAKWYSLDNVSVHASSYDFFRKKNIRGDLYGGRLNAFNMCRGLAMYRHPRDIFRSALNYNFDPNNTVFGCYMDGFSRKEKLKALLEPESIAGDLGGILNDMANWIFFPNIISMGYEEFTESGAPNSDPVWQIQLLLHIDGEPHEYLSRSYGNSDTFREGKIFTPDDEIESELSTIYSTTTYYMQQLGYTKEEPSNSFFYNRRLQGVQAKDYRPIDIPIKTSITENYLTWYLDGRFYACNNRFSEKLCRILSIIDKSLYFEEADYETIRLKVCLYGEGTYFSRVLLRILRVLQKQKHFNKFVSKVLR